MANAAVMGSAGIVAATVMMKLIAA